MSIDINHGLQRRTIKIGSALKELFEDGVVQRKDLWITSKLWCTDHAPEYVQALEQILRNKFFGIGSALKKLFEDGVVQRKDLWITSKLWCTDHAPEYVQDALEQILRNKVFGGYSPLGSPGYQKSDILKNPILNMVAEKLSKSPAQVALRWALEMGHSVLPKSTNETRLKENFDVFDWSIPEDLFAKIGSDHGIRVPSIIIILLVAKSNPVEAELLQPDDLEAMLKIGSALKKLFEDGVVQRKDLWITSKLWCTDHAPEYVQEALEQILRNKLFGGYSPLRSPGYQKSDILKNPILNMVAEKLSKSPAQVALCWALEMGHSVLPKGTNETRLKENFDVFDWSIPEDLFAKFSEIEQARSHFSSHTTLKSSV
ncbi:hypothetical protein TEA_014212 [Camellia sinensis var. sinensis]|uniref:NADP-dependent oxidoreductase domain-containing protein n=1 Tax=Camellia sinensis var. sinensis TaxID=542762 RepID=A0A4S4EFM6_CAMSN|nr:hypothetical protein TEA_014212 [Camellia sinensis var. sinensis]